MPLPSEKKPHPARHAFGVVGLSAFTLLILGSFFFAAFYMRSLVEGNQLAAVVTATLVDLANGDRKGEKLGGLAVNPVLVAAAKAKADDMAAKGYFAHVSPDGRDSWSWFADAGYAFSYAGENLAVNFSDSEDVERAWMNSPSHRANIMNGKFTEIGIATAVGEYKGKKTTFVVQMFGRPSSVRAPISVASEPVSAEETAVAVAQPAAAAVVPDAVAAEAAAPAELALAPVAEYASAADYFASSPQNLLRMIYLVSALAILLALAFATELEWRRHHLRHVVAAGLLIALMGGLFTAADHFVFTEPVVGGAYIAVEGP